MSVLVRKTGVQVLTFVVVVFLLVTYYIETPAQISGFADTLTRWGLILVAIAVGIGGIKLVQIQMKSITLHKGDQWIYSLTALTAMFLFIVVGLVFGVNDDKFKWIYGNIFSPLTSTTYGLFGFFIASASYRVLRIRKIDSAILVIAGVLVMISNVALGELIWKDFPMIGSFINTVLSMAVFRAMAIGVGLGFIILGLRTMLGLEKGFSGVEK